MAAWRGISLRGQALSGRDPDLLADQVDPQHGLGDRVLDLESGVHLQGVEVVAGNDEFDGAGILVSDGRRSPDRRLRHGLATLLAEPDRGCFFEQLLMPPLDGALALAQGKGGPLGIGQNLHLDMPWVLEVALQIHVPAAE